MDALMDISIIIQLVIAIIMLLSAVLIFVTIIINKMINQNLIFVEVVKHERDLRVKLNEYKMKMRSEEGGTDEWEELALNYDGLLFDYYEFLALCIYKKLINENYSKRYFRNLLKSTKEHFDNGALFKEEFEEGLVGREQYPGLQWLFKRWNI